MEMTLPLYAGLMALLYIYASLGVIRLRRRHRIPYGSGGNEELRRWVAAHSNFSAYAPFSLLMLFLIENGGGSRLEIHIFGILLLLGRGVHLAALGVFEGQKNFKWRPFGMYLTLFPMIAMALRLILI